MRGGGEADARILSRLHTKENGEKTTFERQFEEQGLKQQASTFPGESPCGRNRMIVYWEDIY